MLGGIRFRQALQARGYYLAQGDRRAVVAIDLNGEVFAVARWANVKSRQFVDRVSDLADLPSVDEMQKHVAVIVREKLDGFTKDVTADFAQAADGMEARRITMVERQRAAREDLQSRQDARWIEEARKRNQRFRKGILGLWDRITGQHARLRLENDQDVTATRGRDAHEKQVLIERQLEERQGLQREIKQSRRVYVRELARLHRHAFDNRQRDRVAGTAFDDGLPELTIKVNRKRREISGP